MLPVSLQSLADVLVSIAVRQWVNSVDRTRVAGEEDGSVEYVQDKRHVGETEPKEQPRC